MHPEEGTLVALRDGEAISETDRAHIATCSTCSVSLEEARARAEFVRRFLEDEADDIDIDRAKARVRARLDRTRAGRGAPIFARGLRRAAAILLVAAGAAYALPSSPVRGWLTGTTESAQPEGPEAVPGTVLGGDTRSIGFAARPGLVLALSGAAPGTEVSLHFETREGVEVSAAEGTRFAIAGDRFEASEVVGPVTIRIPANAPALTIMLDERMMFTGTGSRFETDGTGTRTDDGWTFTTSER